MSIRRGRTWASVSIGMALALMSTGCSVTQKAEVENPGKCAIIPPSTCARLAPGTSQQAGLRYINPDAQWSRYKKVMINPVTFWTSEKSTVSAADQQALANYFYQTLVTKIGTKFPVVDTPGPDVIRLQVAIISATEATPVLRTISMLVPQARVLASLKYLATDSYPFVGGAEADFLATDSMNGQVLGAAVDNRIGGGSMANAAVWQLGDAENAMDAWAELAATRLQQLSGGQGMS